ncbi:MAG: AAA family ATPase [Planctomycetota bacterium]
MSTDSLFEVPPFPSFPSTDRYVPLGSVRETIDRVSRGIEARESILLIIGPPGSGKSLACRKLEQKYRTSHQVVRLGDAPLVDASDVTRHLLHALRADLRSLSDQELHLALVDHLSAENDDRRGLLLIVDEAQSLSTEALEAIRMATNISRDGIPLVTAVLCGNNRLDETLTLPSMEPLVQRVSTRCYLHPLNAIETREYINGSIRACGAEPTEAISDEAIAAIHHASSGVPRLINQLMTQSIDVAEARDQIVIDEPVVDAAWAQLQQLPGPIIDETELAQPISSIEFAPLADTKSEPAPTELDHRESGETAIAEGSNAEKTAPAEDSHLDDVAAEELEAPISEEAAIVLQAAEASEQLLEQLQTVATLGSYESADPLPIEALEATVSSESIPSSGIKTSTDATPSLTKLVPDGLFGDFDDEEEIAVGAAAPAPTSIAGAVVTAEPLATEPESDHVESGIVASSEDLRIACDESADLLTLGGDQDHEPVTWLTEDEDGMLVRDDKDLLVIEDEISLDEPDAVILEEEDDDEVIAVDFQAMLSKMRASG